MVVIAFIGELGSIDWEIIEEGILLLCFDLLKIDDPSNDSETTLTSFYSLLIPLILFGPLGVYISFLFSAAWNGCI